MDGFIQWDSNFSIFGFPLKEKINKILIHINKKDMATKKELEIVHKLLNEVNQLYQAIFNDIYLNKYFLKYKNKCDEIKGFCKDLKKVYDYHIKKLDYNQAKIKLNNILDNFTNYIMTQRKIELEEKKIIILKNDILEKNVFEILLNKKDIDNKNLLVKKIKSDCKEIFLSIKKDFIGLLSQLFRIIQENKIRINEDELNFLSKDILYKIFSKSCCIDNKGNNISFKKIFDDLISRCEKNYFYNYLNSNIFKIELILNDCFCNINFLVTLSISDKLINKKDIQFIQDVLNELKNNMYNNFRNLDDMEKKLMKIQNIFLELTEITKYFGNKKNLM